MTLTNSAQLAVFLGGVWVASKTLLDACAFVNALRETVVIGWKDGRPLALAHRRVLRNDWLFTMVGAVTFPLVYGVVLLVLGFSVEEYDGALSKVAIALLSSVPIIGSVLFIACGLGDLRLMNNALKAAALASVDGDAKHPA